MYNYNAYNLGISSALPLPELQPSAEVAADVTITIGSINWSPPPEARQSDELCFEIDEGEVYFYWAQLGKFCVRAGREIVIDPFRDVEERVLRLPLLGTVFAVLLHQRGYLVLHASAVAVNGQSIILVGHKGRGKSTMAATLYGRGHQLIADDVVALVVDDHSALMVMPGFPQIKLYPEAAISSLGNDPGALSKLAHGYEKCGRHVADRFAQKPLPLRAIYLLGFGEEAIIRPLDPQAAVLTIIGNSYMTRFGNQLLKGTEASSHLRKCTKLVRQVGVSRLERPCDLSLLPWIAQLIEEHILTSEDRVSEEQEMKVK